MKTQTLVVPGILLTMLLASHSVYAVNACQAFFGHDGKALVSGRYKEIKGAKNPLLGVTLKGLPESQAFRREGVFLRGVFKPELARIERDENHGDRTVYLPSGKPKVFEGVEYIEFPNSTAMSTLNPRNGQEREFVLTRGVRKYEAGIRLDRGGENSPSGYVSDVLLFERVNGKPVYRGRLLSSAPELGFFFEDPRISVIYENESTPHYYLSGTDYSSHVPGSSNPDVMNRYVELQIDENGLPLKVVVDEKTKKPAFKNLSPEPLIRDDGSIVFVDAKNATIAQNDDGQIVVRTRLRPDFNNEYVKSLAGNQKWNYAEQVFVFNNFADFTSYNWNDAVTDVFGAPSSAKRFSSVRPVSAKTIITEQDLRENLNETNSRASRLAVKKTKGLGPGTRPLRVTRKGNELFVSDDPRGKQISIGAATNDQLKTLKIKDGKTVYLTFDHEIRYVEQVVNGKKFYRRHYSASIKVFDRTLMNMIGYLPDVIQPVTAEERGLNSGILDLQHVYPMGFVIDQSAQRPVVRVYAGASDAHTTTYAFDILKLLSETRASERP